MPITLDEALERLPKVELHCHIEGTMRSSTVLELAAANEVELPTQDLAALYRYESLDGFLSVFWMVQACLRTRDDWRRLAYESVVDAAEHGRVYAESFFTPARHLAGGQLLADIVAGLDEGITAAESETGARCVLVADIDRAYGAEAARDLVEGVVGLRRADAPGAERVIGIGMDSTELGIDPLSFAEAFSMAGKAGLRRTAHQGEDTGPDAIRACVEVLGAERIDHGLTVMDDDDLTERFVGEQIPLTVCPTSNVLVANRVKSIRDHPFAKMRQVGMLATLNTDDPALIEIDLGSEYRAVREALGWGFDDMVRIAHDGVEGSWLDAGERRKLNQIIEREARILSDDLG